MVFSCPGEATCSSLHFVDCHNENFTCLSQTEWKCLSDHKCISVGKFCDGVENCADGSDEANCRHQPCSQDYIKCGNLETCVHVSINTRMRMAVLEKTSNFAELKYFEKANLCCMSYLPAEFIYFGCSLIHKYEINLKTIVDCDFSQLGSVTVYILLTPILIALMVQMSCVMIHAFQTHLLENIQ